MPGDTGSKHIDNYKVCDSGRDGGNRLQVFFNIHIEGNTAELTQRGILGSNSDDRRSRLHGQAHTLQQGLGLTGLGDSHDYVVLAKGNGGHVLYVGVGIGCGGNL